MEPSEEVKKFFADCTALVEATNFEKHTLWLINSLSGYKSRKWVSESGGYLCLCGFVSEDRSVWISVDKVKVADQVVLFWHATSPYVDYLMIEEWLQKYVPEAYTNKTEAGNFHTVFST